MELAGKINDFFNSISNYMNEFDRVVVYYDNDLEKYYRNQEEFKIKILTWEFLFWLKINCLILNNLL